LFSVIIDELVYYFEQHSVRGVHFSPDILEIFKLLFADDVALISDTVVGLQNQLNLLYEFCECWKVSVKVENTSIVVFKKGGRLSKHEHWKYNYRTIECVNSFTYVGIYLSSTLSMYKTVDSMAIKCKKVLMSLLNSLYEYMPFSNECYFKIFDAKVTPILLYGSELWGIQ